MDFSDLFFCPIEFKCPVSFHHFYVLCKNCPQDWHCRYCPYVAGLSHFTCLWGCVLNSKVSWLYGVPSESLIGFFSFLYLQDSGSFASEANSRLLNHSFSVCIFSHLHSHNDWENDWREKNLSKSAFLDGSLFICWLIPTEIIMDLIILWSFPSRLLSNL